MLKLGQVSALSYLLNAQNVWSSGELNMLSFAKLWHLCVGAIINNDKTTKQQKQQAGYELNIKLANVIHERGQNEFVYTNTTILWEWIILVKGEDVMNK